MPHIVFSINVSLDGYFEDADGDIGFGQVTEELHAHFNEWTARRGGELVGRRTYELMEAFWPTADEDPEVTSPTMREYAGIYRRTPKHVYSTSLASVGPNATLRRGVDADEVRSIVARAEGDLSLGGPQLMAEFARLGLVDEWRMYVHPVVLGAGKPVFAPGLHLDLELIDTRRFDNGVVLLHHRTRR